MTDRPWKRALIVVAVLLLVAPALAEKVPPEEIGDAEKYAAGEGQPSGLEGLPPANDDCAGAIALGVPSSTFGTTVGATIDAPPAFTCGTTVTTAGVWYTAVGNGNTYTATTCTPGTDYDTKVSVYCRDCVNLACVGGNDDQSGPFDPACDVINVGFNRGSTVTFCTEFGATYDILVHGFGGATGDFQLDLSDDGVACSGGVACAPRGACCDGLGGCSSETEAGCAALAGIYLGDDTQCFTPFGDPNTYSATPGLPIPDNNPAGVTSTITVPDSFAIADVNVNLTVTHTFIDDLIFSLEHVPTGTTVLLSSRACGGENNLDITVDDEAGDLVCAEPLLGSFNPVSLGGEFLSAFDGLDAAGDWTLTVSDVVGADTGTLDAWGLEIDGGTPVCAYQPPNILEIPTLEPGGLAILVLLLGGGAILVLRRRRRV